MSISNLAILITKSETRVPWKVCTLSSFIENVFNKNIYCQSMKKKTNLAVFCLESIFYKMLHDFSSVIYNDMWALL